MKHGGNFDSSKVRTEYRDGVSETAPIDERKYTLTHSDVTGEYFVTVGRSYAEDLLNELRDDVLLEFRRKGQELILSGRVLVDFGHDLKAARFRNEIFQAQMPSALKAIRYGDRGLYERCPRLDQVRVQIQYCSEYEEFHQVYDYGRMGEYR